MSVIDSRVVNIDELKLEHFEKGGKFECDAVRIGPLLGAKDLGYSYDVVPPGKRSCLEIDLVGGGACKPERRPFIGSSLHRARRTDSAQTVVFDGAAPGRAREQQSPDR